MEIYCNHIINTEVFILQSVELVEVIQIVRSKFRLVLSISQPFIAETVWSMGVDNLFIYPNTHILLQFFRNPRSLSVTHMYYMNTPNVKIDICRLL